MRIAGYHCLVRALLTSCINTLPKLWGNDEDIEFRGDIRDRGGKGVRRCSQQVGWGMVVTISVHGAAKATTERRRQAGGFMVNSSRRRWGTGKGSGTMRREIVAIRDSHIKHNVRAQTWQAWGQHMWGTTRCMRMTTTTGHDTRDRDDRRELTGSA